MQIYPAIDLKDGKCVRLMQGDFEQMVVFNDNPVDAAMEWVNAGATFIHVVDLDGARLGSAHNNDAISKIVKESKIPIQVGGGIRNIRDVEDKLNIGVRRVILGTAAVNDLDFVKRAVEVYGDRIAVGIDAKNGMVATHAWENISNVSAVDLCREMEKIGVKTIIYTDISKDGMMQGPNIEATKELVDLTGMDIIASGGVSTMSDLEKTSKIGVEGVIIGKALYQGALDLKQVINLFEK